MTSIETPAAGVTRPPAAGSKPRADHGTLSRARGLGCKCPACRKVSRDYTNARTRLIAYGRWQPYADAEPVRAHIRMLSSFGVGVQRTRVLAGMSNGSLCRLLYGHGDQRGPSRRIRTETADRVLAIRPSIDLVAPSALVDGTGTRRRLQGLVAVGWPQIELARRAGIDKMSINDQLHEASTTARGSTARTIRDLYEQLWNVDPCTQGVGQRWAKEARAHALANGWVPPAAWDDDYIDSPAATPDVGEEVARYVAITEDATWLIETQDYTIAQAAHRLGITRNHLERALSYARQKGVAA
ncbi:hypothetical protein [Streptomyces sp. NBC_01268]|uniref:hypothetical protein n=1 Tax=Streptomyces sp. NBC_01268 TaxID=2903806 RepID=UPI002E331AB9|nr:hypothetical protein [Streptomyces sp. NBC_01268]